MPQPAIILLNWRRYDLTRRCLAVLPPWPTYLVDNESDASALTELCGAFPQVRAMPQAKNLGFPGGMNQGLRQALEDGATQVVLLNNDAIPAEGALERLQATLAAQPQAAAVGPLLTSPGPLRDAQVTSAGVRVRLPLGRVRTLHHGHPPSSLPSGPFEVDAICGACMMIDADALRAFGLLDEAFFFYYEDLELCLRLRRAGRTVWVEPRARVVHEGGATIGRSPAKAYYGCRNQLRLVETQAPAPNRLMRWSRRALILSLHSAALLREGGPPLIPGLRAIGAGLRDHRRGRYGPAPALR